MDSLRGLPVTGMDKREIFFEAFLCILKDEELCSNLPVYLVIGVLLSRKTQVIDNDEDITQGGNSVDGIIPGIGHTEPFKEEHRACELFLELLRSTLAHIPDKIRN